MSKILVVDDDEDLRENLAEVLESSGYLCKKSSSGIDAIKKASEEKFDIIIQDLVMPGLKGMELLLELKKISPQTKIIVITAFATIDSAIDAIKKGASEYISKPFDVEELLTIIRRVIEEAKFEKNLSHMNVDQVLGSLSNPTRRQIIKFLNTTKYARFSELLKTLSITENAKIAFHLKMLKDANIIEQNSEKLYKLTKNGLKVCESLQLVEKMCDF